MNTTHTHAHTVLPRIFVTTHLATMATTLAAHHVAFSTSRKRAAECGDFFVNATVLQLPVAPSSTVKRPRIVVSASRRRVTPMDTQHFVEQASKRACTPARLHCAPVPSVNEIVQCAVEAREHELHAEIAEQIAEAVLERDAYWERRFAEEFARWHEASSFALSYVS